MTFRLFRRIEFFLKMVLINFSVWRQGVDIKIVHTQEELGEAYHFIWRIYSEEDYIDPDDYPDKKLEDKYSQVSVYFSAFKNQKMIGVVRLVLPSELGLPTENAFNLLNFKLSRHETAEVSKFCIHKDYRGLWVSLGLLKRIYEYTKRKNIKYWLIGMPPRLKEHFEKFFWVRLITIPTGPLRQDHIEERRTARKYFQKALIKPYLLDIKELGK